MINQLCDKINWKDSIVSGLFRTMADRMYNDAPCNVLGAWDMFEIPFDEWENYYEKYGFDFINKYVIWVPTNILSENEFITNFICSKLQDDVGSMDLSKFTIFLSRTDDRRTVKSILTREISKRIKDGTFNASSDTFNKLYQEHMVNADAYRAVMGRRDDRGAMQVNNIKTAESVVKALRSLAKMDTLPDLLESTMKFLLDRIFDNLGDGDGIWKWRPDEKCFQEGQVLTQLVHSIYRKATTGKFPLVIKRLFDDGLVDRMRGFDEANRQACEVPGKPKAKLKCEMSSIMRNMVELLDEVKPAVDEIVAIRSAPKPKKTRKKAVPVQA
jgi:hypothetical protein